MSTGSTSALQAERAGSNPVESTKVMFWGGRNRKVFSQTCDHCQSTYFVPKHRIAKNRFCSKECFYKSKKRSVEQVCSYCGAGFTRRPSAARKSRHGYVFCSRTCKDAAQRLDSPITAIRPSHYGTGTASYREIAKREKPTHCNRCGYAKIVEILEVHHIDRDRGNNTLDNLEILCPNCHQEEHFTRQDGRFS